MTLMSMEYGGLDSVIRERAQSAIAACRQTPS